jgi:hypothetical protein
LTTSRKFSNPDYWRDLLNSEHRNLTLFRSCFLSYSRIIAVTHPDNTLLWESDSIPGEVQGTPIIAKSVDHPGEYVYFTHNQKDNIGTVDEAVFGSFSIVQAEEGGGKLIFTEDAGDSDDDPNPSMLVSFRQAYAPLGVAHNPVGGRYPGGETKLHDLLVWGTNILDGEDDAGYTRAFQLPRLFNPIFARKLFDEECLLPLRARCYLTAFFLPQRVCQQSF